MERMKEKNNIISVKQAYETWVHMLYDYYERTSSSDIIDILGGSEYFNDVDRPVDTGYWDLWVDMVEKVINGEEPRRGKVGLNDEINELSQDKRRDEKINLKKAFEAMVHMLYDYYKSTNKKDYLELLKEAEYKANSNSPVDIKWWELWMKAVTDVKEGKEPKRQIIVHTEVRDKGIDNQ